MSILELTDVHTYYGQIHALKGISFRVEPGEIVTLIGGNGAGKSTTLNTISGLLRPRHGLMRRPPRPETIAAIGECPIPTLLQHLHHRQLHKPIPYRWNAQLALTSVRFRYFYPPYGLRFIGPVQELFSEN